MFFMELISRGLKIIAIKLKLIKHPVAVADEAHPGDPSFVAMH